MTTIALPVLCTGELTTNNKFVIFMFKISRKHYLKSLSLKVNKQPKVIKVKDFNTVDLEMFAGTKFSLIFTNLLPREFKVLANNENAYIKIAI